MAEETRTNDTDIVTVADSVLRSTGAEEYGVTREGFVPKPFARLLAEKITLARILLGDNIDLTSGSAIRKLLELTALEDARTWAALAEVYDNNYVTTASGFALSRLGEELGIPRPFMQARGRVKLKLDGQLPDGHSPLTLPRGSRLYSQGGHHAELDETVELSASSPERDVAVIAFYPGADHNLNPTIPNQKLQFWNYGHIGLSGLLAARQKAGLAGLIVDVVIEHSTPLTGGERQWSDDRYRSLLLRVPRSLWSAEGIYTAVSLIPGVQQVQVRDGWGGLDIRQSIFGNFNFLERVFSSERDLGSPYYFEVLVAPTPGAIWDGIDGLKIAIESTLEDLRPISIFPQIIRAEQVYVGIAAELVVRGIPLPIGSRDTINASEPARALKQRLLQRTHAYIDKIQFGDPVRPAEIIWSMMNEPGLVDIMELKLLRYPSTLAAVNFASSGNLVQEITDGDRIELQANEIPVLVEDISRLTIV